MNATMNQQAWNAAEQQVLRTFHRPVEFIGMQCACPVWDHEERLFIDNGAPDVGPDVRVWPEVA